MKVVRKYACIRLKIPARLFFGQNYSLITCLAYFRKCILKFKVIILDELNRILYILKIAGYVA